MLVSMLSKIYLMKLVLWDCLAVVKVFFGIILKLDKKNHLYKIFGDIHAKSNSADN